MRNIRCPACGSILAKEEDDRLILRTGYGKRKVFHAFNKKDGTLTCWSCREIINLKEENNGGFQGIAGKS